MSEEPMSRPVAERPAGAPGRIPRAAYRRMALIGDSARVLSVTDTDI